MKAIILLGTLKREGLSHTETLVEFFTGYLQKKSVAFEVIKLVRYHILPGTYSNMGEDDDWPAILEKITAADILIFATPIWWGNHSSETQRAIERLDELHDEIMEGKLSRLEGKIAGIIITGDSDGSQHIIGSIGNFVNALGMFVPPFATLSVQSKAQAKKKNTPKEELMVMYEKEYAETAKKMVERLVAAVPE